MGITIDQWRRSIGGFGGVGRTRRVRDDDGGGALGKIRQESNQVTNCLNLLFKSKKRLFYRSGKKPS